MMVVARKRQGGGGGGWRRGWRGALLVTAALLWVLLFGSRVASALPVPADEDAQGAQEDEGVAWGQQGDALDTLAKSQQADGEATQTMGMRLTDNTETDRSSSFQAGEALGNDEHGEQQEKPEPASAQTNGPGGNSLAALDGDGAARPDTAASSSSLSSAPSASAVRDGSDATSVVDQTRQEEQRQERQGQGSPEWKQPDGDADDAQDEQGEAAQHGQTEEQEGDGALTGQMTNAEEQASPDLEQQGTEEQKGGVDWAAGAADHRDEPLAADEDGGQKQGRYDEHHHHLPNQAGFLSGQPSVGAAETTEERTVEIPLSNADGSRVSVLGFSISGGSEYSSEPLRIVQVVPDSAAARAGLRTDDEVLSIQNKDMQGATQEDGTRAIASVVSHEQEASLTLVVKGQTLSSALRVKQTQEQGEPGNLKQGEVTEGAQAEPHGDNQTPTGKVVTAAPDAPQISSDDTFLEVHIDTSLSERVGLSAAEMAEGNARYIKVTAVAPGSPADMAGILAGDKVLSVDSTPVSTLADLKAAIAGAENTRVRVQLWRSPQHDDHTAAHVNAQGDIAGPSPARGSEVDQGQDHVLGDGAPRERVNLGTEEEQQQGQGQQRQRAGDVVVSNHAESREEREALGWDGNGRSPSTRRGDVDLDVGGNDAEEEGAPGNTEDDKSKEGSPAVGWEVGKDASAAHDGDTPKTETQGKQQEADQRAQEMQHPQPGFEGDAGTASNSREPTGSSTGASHAETTGGEHATRHEEDDDAGGDATDPEAIQHLRSKENRLEEEYLQRHTSKGNNSPSANTNAQQANSSSSSSSTKVGGVREGDATSWGDDDDQELAEEMQQEKQWEAQLQEESSQGRQQAGQKDEQGLAVSQTLHEDGPDHGQADRKPEWETWQGTAEEEKEQGEQGEQGEDTTDKAQEGGGAQRVGLEETQRGGEGLDTFTSDERQDQRTEGFTSHEEQPNGSELEQQGVAAEEGDKDEVAGETWHRGRATGGGTTSGTTTTAMGGGTGTTTTTTTTTTATMSPGRDTHTTTSAEVSEEEEEEGDRDREAGSRGGDDTGKGDKRYESEGKRMDESRIDLRERVSSLREQFDEDLATMNREEATLKTSEDGGHKHDHQSELDASQQQQDQQRQQRESYETSGRSQDEVFERDVESSGFPMIGLFMIFAVLLVIGLMYQRKIKSVVLGGGGASHNGHRHRTYSRRRR